MNVRNLVPLGLTIAIAASLAACGKNETAPAAGADAKPAFDLSQIKTPLISLNSADLDPAISACTDLNGFVNSKWLKANPVPGDQTTWGSFEILRERSLEVQHALVQQAAASQAKAGSVEAKIGDIWKTGNDEAKIESAGLAPLQPQLDKITALNDTAAITQYLRDSQAEGKGVLFSLFANADYKDSANVIAYVGQGGLGLPEKGYYFDDAQAKIRDAYVAYIAQVLTLSGVDAAQAAEQAKAVMAFETRLAKASMSRIEMRDPAKRYNPLSAADADKLTPNFSWTALFDTLKVPAAQKFSLAQPGFFGEMDKMLADVPASTWQAYLRFHTIDDASPYLSSQFEKANFEFYGKTLRGQQEMQPRWKRVLESVNGGMGEALGQLYVDAVFPAESKVAMQHLVENLSQALKARLEQLPWMGEETKKKALEKWASFTPKIGYPDKWRDWAGLQTNGDSYLGNMQAARAFNYRYMLDKIGKPVDKTEWGMT
ncbi:M13 family metallopeptidase, partial [Stenotrophomonas maltophilia]